MHELIRSPRLKRTLLIAVASWASIVVCFCLYFIYDYFLHRDQIEKRADLLAKIIVAQSRPALQTNSNSNFSSNLELLGIDSNIASIVILNSKGETYASWKRKDSGIIRPQTDSSVRWKNGYLTVIHQVEDNNTNYGNVILIYSGHELMARIYANMANYGIVCLALCIAALMLARRLSSIQFKDISYIISKAGEISATRNFTQRLQMTEDEELDLLIQTINLLFAYCERQRNDRRKTEELLSKEIQQKNQTIEYNSGLLQATYDNSLEPVIIIDSQAKVIDLNNAACKLLQIASQYKTGWHFTDLLSKEHQAEFWKWMTQQFAISNFEHTIELTLLTNMEIQIPIRMLTHQMKDNHRALTVLQIQDLSNIKNQEQLMQKVQSQLGQEKERNQLVSELMLPRLSTSLQNHWHTTSGLLKIIDPATTATSRDLDFANATLQSLSSQIGRTVMFINDIKDWPRLVSDTLQQEHQSFNVSRLLDNVVSTISKWYPESKSPIALRTDSRLTDNFSGYPLSLRRALLSIIGLCLDKRACGDVTITSLLKINDLAFEITYIPWHSYLADSLGVTHNSNTLNSNSLNANTLKANSLNSNSLNSNSLRANSPQNAKKSNMNLRYALCQQLVSRMGGKIAVESSSDQERITIEIPISRETATTSPSPLAVLRNRHALVIASDGSSAGIIKELLCRKMQMRTTIARTANQANAVCQIHQIGGNQIDILFIDHDMDPLSGTKLLKNLKDVYKFLDTVPIIMVISLDSALKKEEYSELGISQVLIKPIALSSMESCVYKAFLHNSRTEAGSLQFWEREVTLTEHFNLDDKLHIALLQSASKNRELLPTLHRLGHDVEQYGDTSELINAWTSVNPHHHRTPETELIIIDNELCGDNIEQFLKETREQLKATKRKPGVIVTPKSGLTGVDCITLLGIIREKNNT